MYRTKQQHHLKLQRYERKNKIATFRRELTHHKQYFNENDGHKGIKVFQMNQEYFNYVTMFYAKEDDFPIVLNYGFQDPTQVCGYEFAIPFETIGTQQQQSPISWSFEAKSNGAWVKLHVFRASEDEVFNSRSRAFSLDNPGRYQDYRFVITETTTGKLSTVQFWRVEVHGLITPMMRNKIQQEEKSIERSSVDEETMKNDWPNRGDDQSDGWPVDGDRNNEKASALKRDVTSVERDIESVVDVDGGGHAVLLMGLAVLFIGKCLCSSAKRENFNQVFEKDFQS